MSIPAAKKYFPWPGLVLAFLAFGIAGYGIAFYLTGDPLSAGFIQGKNHYQNFKPTPFWTLALMVHVAGGSLALIAGGLQWVITRLGWRKNHPRGFRRFHLVVGVVYTGSIVAAAFGGLVLAPQAMGGWVSALGFGILDILWITTTCIAVFIGKQVRKPRLGTDLSALRQRHRTWMLRSYSLTAAAITLRLWLPIFTMALSLEFVSSYLVISWLCWVPNLVAAEILSHRDPGTLKAPNYNQTT